MKNKQVLELKSRFFEYVSGFYGNTPEQNRMFNLKEVHTLRVCANILRLGRSLNLTQDELKIVEISALFHDIGRFKQYRDYATFNDKKSVNHAKLGIRELSVHKILKDLSTEEKRYIVTAIAWHNAYQLPDIQNKKQLLFIKLLRDADKLDIWKVVIDYYSKKIKQGTDAIFLNFPDKGQAYSEKIINALNNGQLVQTCHLSCLTDLKLLQISWVYDLNFNESYKLLRQSRFIEKIEQTLPPEKQIKDAVKIALTHIEKMAAS
ncbi:HD domain-containing protein [Desulfobacula toluolica]|uniref:Metal-dependent phosphohydrolase n=1 Tax=Desulfobacula toluolica (strain DSM 7467 / Tol2) TaxID=651182 RepID=K0NCB6_DESTT|nr:HD domain-containing protein [Desulfobacula toluolica]CCK82079.1 metal-dependent phosphohydrolase [Desulfobacula toluolica Tol2]